MNSRLRRFGCDVGVKKGDEKGLDFLHSIVYILPSFKWGGFLVVNGSRL